MTGDQRAWEGDRQFSDETGERRVTRSWVTAALAALLAGVLVADCAVQPRASSTSAPADRPATVPGGRLAAAVAPDQLAGTLLRLERLLVPVSLRQRRR